MTLFDLHMELTKAVKRVSPEAARSQLERKTLDISSKLQTLRMLDVDEKSQVYKEAVEHLRQATRSVEEGPREWQIAKVLEVLIQAAAGISAVAAISVALASRASGRPSQWRCVEGRHRVDKPSCPRHPESPVEPV